MFSMYVTPRNTRHSLSSLDMAVAATELHRARRATHREIFFKTGYFSTLAILGLKGVTGNSFQSCAADDCSEHAPSEAQL